MAGSLPQVDFYHLESDNDRGIQLFCCRLTDKAWQLGNRVCILTSDAQRSQKMDELLWTWRDDSFLPHTVCQENDADESPVLICHRLPVGLQSDLLINLSGVVPPELGENRPGLSRIAEIIDQNPNTKQQGRLRYSYYDKNNYALKYHEITSS